MALKDMMAAVDQCSTAMNQIAAAMNQISVAGTQCREIQSMVREVWQHIVGHVQPHTGATDNLCSAIGNAINLLDL